jgi:glycosyltransferase involved in cell wall biosynthesis
MEAAAKGRPVITTDVPGCRDAIEPNISGVLVPVKNSFILADTIFGLMGNHELLLEMGKNGRKLAENNFSESGVSQHHMSIYAELINKNY